VVNPLEVASDAPPWDVSGVSDPPTRKRRPARCSPVNDGHEGKSGAGSVEMIRVLRVARRSAVVSRVSRSQVTNQLHALTVTAPPALREQLEGRTIRARVAIAAKFRPGDEPDSVLAATRFAMKKLALRFRALDAEIKDLDGQLTRLVTATAPLCEAPMDVKRRSGWFLSR
jgi:hypothetical protein